MLRRLLDEDRAKLLGSIGLNSLGDLYSVFPPKAREFSESVFSRLKDLLNKAPHSAALRALLHEDELSGYAPTLWNHPYGRYLAQELDRLHYEFPDELLHSSALLDLAFEYQTFLCELLRAEVASFSFSSGFSALMEAVRLCLKSDSPHLVVATTLPESWQTALKQNFPEVTLTFCDLGADTLPPELAKTASAFVTTSEVKQVELTALRERAPQARVIDVIFDPLSLYPRDNANAFDFTVVELQDVLCAQRQVTGISSGLLAGKRELFAKAQTWLVGKSRVTKQKYWFQPSSSSTAPLPRFLPLEGLKAWLTWQGQDRETLSGIAERSRAQFTLLRSELERMGVPCVFAFHEGRQGLFRVPRLEARLARATNQGWPSALPASAIWGSGLNLDLASVVWIRVGAVSDAQVTQLVEALTHD